MNDVYRHPAPRPPLADFALTFATSPTDSVAPAGCVDSEDSDAEHLAFAHLVADDAEVTAENRAAMVRSLVGGFISLLAVVVFFLGFSR